MCKRVGNIACYRVLTNPVKYTILVLKDIIALVEQAAENGLIAKYGVPENHIIVDELPKTSVGKHDKKVMREMYDHQTEV